jgi:hypothetical protein
MSNSTPIKLARKHLAAHRQITRNLRLKRYKGRNGSSTEMTLRYHLARAESYLLGTADRELSGQIWAEHQLASRLSQARDEGQVRPELELRLKNHRRAIREAIAA